MVGMERYDWQTELARSIRDVPALYKYLGRTEAPNEAMLRVAASYPLFVPLPYAAKIDPNDPDDPLLRQILPSACELDEVAGFTVDPLGEFNAARESRTLQKYAGRALILTTDSCAVHCRFCFRRHFPGENEEVPPCDHGGESRRRSRLVGIREDPAIEEVILSGGDPLMLPDEELSQYAEDIYAIPHVRRLRIHTRLPVLIPGRITNDLVDLLRPGKHHASYLVVHVNHPREVDTAFQERIGSLIDAGIPVLSQTVLLQGVNADAGVLAGLFRKLANIRIIPYYLHQLDKVAGTAHFEVADEHARALIGEIATLLPGYAVPRLVRELPDCGSKFFL